METTPYKTLADALKASLGDLPKPGWQDDAVIREAVEDTSARGNTMIVLVIFLPDGRIYKDHLTNTKRGAPRLRLTCEAVGALDRYYAGKISPDAFVNKVIRIKLSVERSTRYGSRAIIESYAASETRVVSLREVAS